MTGSALSKYLQVQAARTVSINLVKVGQLTQGRVQGGKGAPAPSDGRLADDGKRFVEVPLGTSCAGRFMMKERDDIEKT